MPTDASTVTIHMAASLDFFIASADGSVSWLETQDRHEKGDDYPDTERFLKSIDCYVIGSRTYETARKLGWCYGDTPTFVLTSRDLSKERESVQLYSGDLKQLVNDRLRPRFGNIWVAGGAMVAREFIRLKLADELSISILPILLGDGIRFIDALDLSQPLHLQEATACKDGMVELRYLLREK